MAVMMILMTHDGDQDKVDDDNVVNVDDDGDKEDDTDDERNRMSMINLRLEGMMMMMMMVMMATMRMVLMVLMKTTTLPRREDRIWPVSTVMGHFTMQIIIRIVLIVSSDTISMLLMLRVVNMMFAGTQRLHFLYGPGTTRGILQSS